MAAVLLRIDQGGDLMTEMSDSCAVAGAIAAHRKCLVWLLEGTAQGPSGLRSHKEWQAEVMAWRSLPYARGCSRHVGSLVAVPGGDLRC